MFITRPKILRRSADLKKSGDYLSPMFLAAHWERTSPEIGTEEKVLGVSLRYMA